MKITNALIATSFFLAFASSSWGESTPESPPPPLWIQDNQWTPCAKEMINAISQAETEGLNPKDYAPGLASLQKADPSKDGDADGALTQLALRYISDIKGERLTPHSVDKDIHVREVSINEKDILTAGIESGSCAWISSLPPQSEDYKYLQNLLAQLRQNKAAGGWATLPAGTKLKMGDRNSTVAILRDQLTQQGIDVPPSKGDLFDEGLSNALKHYQSLHGLEPDGAVGPGTLKALNTSVDDRIRQVTVAMERQRWMPDTLASRYILVNIPGYYLKAVKDGQVAFTMPVITGKSYRETPVFNAPMTSVIFNPSWHVPSSIAVADKLPKLKQNPHAFSGKGYHFYDSNGQEVDASSVNWDSYSGGNFPFRIRQDPGNANALGRIRFTIESPFDVYLHGTPSQNLFAESSRSFSSGCIRVEDPAKLALFVFDDPGTWTPQKIKSKASTTATETVKLPEPLQVYITYSTVWQDTDGHTHMVDDVYGQDAQIAKALHL